jgi:hypothetical protein
MSRCIIISMHPEKPKRLIIWNGGGINLQFTKAPGEIRHASPAPMCCSSGETSQCSHAQLSITISLGLVWEQRVINPRKKTPQGGFSWQTTTGNFSSSEVLISLCFPSLLPNNQRGTQGARKCFSICSTIQAC